MLQLNYSPEEKLVAMFDVSEDWTQSIILSLTSIPIWRNGKFCSVTSPVLNDIFVAKITNKFLAKSL